MSDAQNCTLLQSRVWFISEKKIFFKISIYKELLTTNRYLYLKLDVTFYFNTKGVILLIIIEK